MRNTLFLMNKFSEIDEEPLSAKEIKNIKKHTE